MHRDDLARVRRQLIVDEGWRADPYLDPRGATTVGVGHRLLPDEEHACTWPASPAQVAAWLDADLGTAHYECQQLSCWPTLTPARQAVLVQMCFNLGLGSLLMFGKLFAAIARQDWEQAAHEMRDSLWHRQVGPRAERLAEQMRTGQWMPTVG